MLSMKRLLSSKEVSGPPSALPSIISTTANPCPTESRLRAAGTHSRPQAHPQRQFARVAVEREEQFLLPRARRCAGILVGRDSWGGKREVVGRSEQQGLGLAR